MSLSYRHLTAFLAVADLNSFTAAADVLYITQGAASALIKDLEGTIGFKLFDRHRGGGVRLTEEGKNFLSYARNAVESLRIAEQYTELVKTHKAGRCKIASAALFSCTILPQILDLYLDKYRNIFIDIVDISANDIVKAIESKNCELGIGPERIVPTNINKIPFFSSTLHAYYHPTHRFASKKVVWEDLNDEPMTFAGREAMTMVQLTVAQEHIKINFNPKHIVNHPVTAFSLVSINKGVTLAARFSKKLANYFGLESQPIGSPLILRQMFFYRAMDSELSHAATVFLELAKTFVNEHPSLI